MSATASWRRLERRLPTLLLLTFVLDRRMQQFDTEVDQQEQHRDRQDDADDHRVVASLDGTQQRRRQPRPVEDVFDEHGAAEQRAHLQPEQGDHRIQGVSEHMHDERPPRRQALGAGRADIVMRQRVEGRGPGHAEHHGRQPLGDGDGRQGEELEVLPRVLREGDIATGRHQAQRLRQQQHQQRPDHEDRHGEQERRDPGGDPVEGAAAMDRGIDAGGHADHDRDQGPREDQFEGPWQAQRDLLGDRIVVDQRAAEVTPRQPREEMAVLGQ